MKPDRATPVAVLSEAEMIEWGRSVGRVADPPLVISLRGDLGAGKSTLARAIARGAGVTEAMPSPTFNLVFRYDTPRGVRIVHADLYRLRDLDEVWELGWSEIPEDGDLVLIEWPERAESVLPVPRWEIEIVEGSDVMRRRVTCSPVGAPAAIPMPGGQAPRSGTAPDRTRERRGIQ